MRRLNLFANYTVTTDKDEAAIEIILPPIVEGGQPITVMYRSNRVDPTIKLSDIKKEAAIWTPVVKTETTKDITPAQWIEIVNWWFDNAGLDETYTSGINTIYSKIGDIEAEVLKAKDWLINTAAYYTDRNGNYPKRKKDIGRFLKGWLNRSLSRKAYGGR